MNPIERWRFAKKAYDGLDGEDLVQFPREIDDKFANRKKIAYYVNYIAPKTKQFVSYIFQKKTMRDIKSPQLQLMLRDADNKGNDIDTFMKTFAVNAKLRGTNIVLVDMPQHLGDTLADQLKERGVPYLVEIPPESIVQYKLDKFGKFEFVIFEEIVDNTEPFGDLQQETIYRYYDKTSWAIYNEDKKLVSKGDHNLGVCPVLYISESNEFPYVGEFVQIADISKRILNLRSELDEILRSQTFSVLTYEIPENYKPDKDETPIKLSTDNLLLYKGSKPEFISPSEAPARVYQDEIKRLEDVINNIGYTDVLDGTNESGIAKRYKFQLLNASLVNFAQRLENLERSIFDVASLWLGIKAQFTVNYPAEFNIKDMKEEIEIASSMFDLGMPESYRTVKLKELVAADMESLDEESLNEIYKELETLPHDRTQQGG